MRLSERLKGIKRELRFPKEKRKRKERELRNVISGFDFWFEDAVTPRLTDINKELKNIEENSQNIQQKERELKREHELKQECNEQEEYVDENGTIIYSESYKSYLESVSDLYGNLAELDIKIDFLSEQRLSIEEMKFLYLYKNFEQHIKSIIMLCFPNAKGENFFRWDNVKTFFKNYDIMIGDIINYNVINDIRVVNNNIKHYSSSINEKVKNANIDEFKYKKYFDYESLTKFYSLVRNEPVKFLEYLAEKIVEYLFVFDDERIDKIVSRYEGRMEKETAIKLAEALKNKIT